MGRLKSVRATLNTFTFIQYQLHEYLTSEDKFRIALNIKFNFLSYNIYRKFLISKEKGYSNSIVLYNLYTKSLLFLWDSVISPLIEVTTNKFFISYRPYRTVKNFIFAIKNYFLDKCSYFSFYTTLTLNDNLTPKSCMWIKKFFPNKHQYLMSSISSVSGVSFKLLTSNLFFSFFNYLFANLVCILIVNIICFIFCFT